MPDTTRQSVRAAMDRLDELGQSADNLQAAGALEVLGAIQGLVIEDVSGAEGQLAEGGEARSLPRRRLGTAHGNHGHPNAGSPSFRLWLKTV